MLTQEIIIEASDVQCLPCLSQLSRILECKPGVPGFLTNPDEHSRGIFVYVSHLLHLAASLGNILLINRSRLRQPSSSEQ